MALLAAPAGILNPEELPEKLLAAPAGVLNPLDELGVPAGLLNPLEELGTPAGVLKLESAANVQTPESRMHASANNKRLFMMFSSKAVCKELTIER
jgi:hypothetical protein